MDPVNGKVLHARVGVIGLGLLGSALAARLLQHGVRVMGFDLDANKLESLANQNMEVGKSAADIFQRCDILLLCLPTSQVVATTLAEASGSLREGQTIIDSTTGDPAMSEATAAEVARRGVHWIEACVCGSSDQVRCGNAVLLLGGEVPQLERWHGLFELLGQRTFHLGGVGSASRFKLVHNLILGLNRAVLAEGLQFARALGFEATEALSVLLETPATSSVMQIKGPKMAQGEYTPQATLAQHLKDVSLILAEARKHGVETPLSAVNYGLLQRAVSLGFGSADNCAIIEAFGNHWAAEANAASGAALAASVSRRDRST